MALPVPSFAALAAGNQPLSLLDQQFTALAQGTTISCAATGQNTIILTPNPSTYVPSLYTDGAPRFVWVQPSTTATGPITINVAGLGPVTGYKQNGAIALGGVAGELVAGGVYTATYSSALTGGAGGFSVDLNAQGPTGPSGAPGPPGPAGPAGPTAGLPVGGAINQVLAKNSAADYDTSWQTIAGGGVSSFNTRIGAVTLVAADVTTAGGALLASPALSGTPTAPTPAAGNNSTQIATTAFVASAAVVRSYLAGLTLSTVGAAITFTVQPGVAADKTNVAMLALASAITKSTAAWAVGTNNGALDTGTIANSTWYHVHLIERTDLTVVDVLISLSATAPTMPANYTFSRRIGSMVTNASGQWTLFSQLGDEFLWSIPTHEVAVSTLGTTSTLFTVNVPTGVQVIARMRISGSNATVPNQLLITSPDESVQASGTPGSNNTFNLTVAGTAYFSTMDVRTSTSGQIRAVASAASTSLNVNTYGWRDRRGRDS